MNYNTVAAISTAQGEGGIGVIRISGDDAVAIADKVFKNINNKSLCDMKGYTAAFGKIVENDETVVLRISDFNTSGLLGSREEINTDWTNLTKSSGASDKKGTAGGSYGIGKYAPFACSDYATVFYSTYDINNEEAYQ